MLRLPAQLLVRAGRVSCEVQHITLPPLDDLVRQVAAHGMREGFDHVVDSAAFASAQIPGAYARVVGAKMVEGDQVSAR